MDRDIFNRIIETYEQLSETADGDNIEEIIALVADKCDCDAQLVIDALNEYSQPPQLPILGIFVDEDGELGLQITGEIGTAFNGEDVSRDPEGVAYYGLAALSFGIASLSANLINNGYSSSDVAAMLQDMLNESLTNADHPELRVSIEAAEETMVTKDGKVLHFPS